MKYRILNVTFCSDKNLYPDKPENAALWFSHMPVLGFLQTKEDGSVEGGFNLDMNVGGTSSHLLLGFKNELQKLGGLDSIGHGAEIQRMPGRRVRLEKEQYETYGHELRPKDTTFVFSEVQPAGNVALFKLHATIEDE